MLQKDYVEQKKLINESKKILEEIENNDKLIEQLMTEEGLEVENNADSTEKLRESLKEVEDYSSKIEINNVKSYVEMLEKEIEKLGEEPSIFKTKLERQTIMLRNLFNLDRIANYNPIGKVDKKSLNNMRLIARKKLAVNKKYAFIEPNEMEKSLKVVIEDRKKVDKVLWRVYNYIVNKKIENEGVYIYFLMLTFATLSNEQMNDREEVIKNLEKLF